MKYFKIFIHSLSEVKIYFYTKSSLSNFRNTRRSNQEITHVQYNKNKKIKKQFSHLILLEKKLTERDKNPYFLHTWTKKIKERKKKKRF